MTVSAIQTLGRATGAPFRKRIRKTPTLLGLAILIGDARGVFKQTGALEDGVVFFFGDALGAQGAGGAADPFGPLELLVGQFDAARTDFAFEPIGPFARKQRDKKQREPPFDLNETQVSGIMAARANHGNGRPIVVARLLVETEENEHCSTPNPGFNTRRARKAPRESS